MRQCLSLILVFSILALSSFAQDTKTVSTSAVSASAVKRTPDGLPILEDGTPIRLRLTHTIVSNKCSAGDRIDFEVIDPLLLDGVTVVRQGAIAWGGINLAETNRPLGRADLLRFDLVAVELSNFGTANLRLVNSLPQMNHSAIATVAKAAAAIELFPVVPLAFAIPGAHTTIPAGTEITAYINGDHVFNPLSEKPAAATAVTTTLTLISTPDGAEVSVDGTFVCSAPARITLTNGDHTVRATMRGYAPYEKKLHASGGRINLYAELKDLQ
jgi:hypothetical protein